ncbi:MAG TPA: glutathione binding-like protein [Rhizobiaceae bacterium]|nr:glutathione binding-like protein [Rhizobiaceae bacterium]
MIDLYSWTTPNGYKVHIMLEECELAYEAHPVNIGRGDQFAPEFLKISPNNRIPAIVDRDGPDGQSLAMCESGAILIYLAEKSGRFLPPAGHMRHAALQWLMFQMSSIGPIFGQTYHYRNDAPTRIEYVINRFEKEARRLYSVLDRRLGEASYLAGEEYTIADIATWPWTHSIEKQGHNPADYPNVTRWHEQIAQRPAVQRGLQTLKHYGATIMNERAHEVLFGETQYARR